MRMQRGIKLVTVVCVVTLLCASGQGKPDSPIVEFSSKTVGLLNWNDMLVSGSTSNANGKFVFYLTEPSLFMVMANDDDEPIIYLYLPEDGNQVELRVDGDILYANGIPRTVSVNEKHPRNFAAWLEKADTAALKALRIISYEGDSTNAVISSQFKRIMEVNPFVLSAGGSDFLPKSWMELHSKQTPLLGFAVNITTNESQAAEFIEHSNYSEARVVMMEDPDTAILDALKSKQAPKLRRLLLFESGEIPTSFAHVKALTLLEAEKAPDLRGLKELTELHIGGDDIALDLSTLPHPEALRALTVDVTDGVTGLEKLVNLEFLNPLESTFTDKELSDLLANHPKLIFLDLSLATIESLKPLEKAANLEVIALGECSTNEVPDFAPLSDLPKLRYVAFDSDLLDDDAVEALSKVCPQVGVYAHDGFCMGSAWLLLFLPAVIIALLVKRSHSSTQRSA